MYPNGKGDSLYEVVNPVELHKYRPYAPGGSKVGFITEYAYSFLTSAWLTFKAKRADRFEVIQAFNPPDIFWPITLTFRAIEGTKFAFDHHDQYPELDGSRFPDGSRLPCKAPCALDPRTHKAANHLIATNDSHRNLEARRRGNYAEPIVELIDDQPRRADLGKLGLARVEQKLAWSHRERDYLGAYQRLTPGVGVLERTGS